MLQQQQQDQGNIAVQKGSCSKDPKPTLSRNIDYQVLHVMNFLVHPVWM
jgi:hypothetical protein